MVFEGSLMVAGVQAELVDGATVKDKRRNLYSMPLDKLRELIGTGWVVVLLPNTLLVVPTGFLTIYVPVIAPCVGLRWSVSSDDACLGRTKLQLKALLASFPELSNASAGYGQCQSWLESS